MKKIVVAAVLMSTAAFGQDGPKILTIDEVVSVYRGLSQIGQYQGICKDGGTEKQCVKDMELSLATRVKIARNIDKAKSVVIAYDKAKQDLIQKLSGGTGQVPNDKFAEFNKQDREAMDASSGLSLDPISCPDLKGSVNPISGPTLAMIWSIMTDTDKCN